MSDPANIPIINPNSNPTEPSKNAPVDPEKFKKLLKVEESEQSQKRQKRNLKKEDEDEEKVENGSTPKAGIFEGLLEKKGKKDSIFDVKKPSKIKTKKSETNNEETLEIKKNKSKAQIKAEAEEKQKKIDKVSETDSGEFFFNESNKKAKKSKESTLESTVEDTVIKKNTSSIKKPELKKETPPEIKEPSSIEPTTNIDKPLKEYSKEELKSLKPDEESIKSKDEDITTAITEEKKLSSDDVKPIQPIEESLQYIDKEKKIITEEPVILEKEKLLSKDELTSVEDENIFNKKELKSKLEEVSQIKDDLTTKREETFVRSKEEKKVEDIAKSETEKKISSKEDDQTTTQISAVHEETKQILTDNTNTTNDEGFSKAPEEPTSLIQSYLESVPIEPIHEIPPYSRLTPEVFDIFQKMIGMISIVKEQGLDRTTVTINMPGSIFDKGNLIIEHFASAANSFNVQFEGQEQAVNLFNDHADDLVAALGHAKLNYSVNIKRAVLTSQNKKE